MNIEHIRAFLEVAETGSFQDAAEKLHVTQSTISARIKTLEDRLRGPLFIRDRKGISLTASGQHFQRRAATVVHAWEQARQEASLPQEVQTSISLGMQYDQWSSILMPWLTWMEENAPQIATNVIAEYSDKIMQQLRDGLLDLALVFQVQYGSDVIIEKFREEALVLVSTSAEQQDIESLCDYIYMDWGEVFRAEHNLLFPKLTNFRFSVGATAVGINHILAHGGCGYFIDRDAGPLIAKGLLHRVENAPILKTPINLVYPRSEQDNPAIQTAIEGLRFARDVTNLSSS